MLTLFFFPGLWTASVLGGCAVVWRGGVAVRPAEERLRAVSRGCRKRLYLPSSVPTNAGPQAPVQSLHGETDHAES